MRMRANKRNSIDKNEGRRERKRIESERKKRGENKRGIFSVFRLSKLDGSRIKVRPCNKSYAWVPKSGSFVKLQEVEIFPTLIISNLKVI